MKTQSSDDIFIQSDSYLTLHYKIVLNSGLAKGEVFIDTFSGPPATLQMGIGQWPSSIEEPLIGRKEGEHFQYALSADKAYGNRNPELIQSLKKSMLQLNDVGDATFNINDQVEFTTSHGIQVSGLLKGFDGEYAIIDFNHPLSGVDLLIDVHILGVM